MKICVLARGVPDGKSPLNGIYEFGIAKILSHGGHDVSIIAVDLRAGGRRKKRGLNRYHIDGIEVFDYAIPVGRVSKNSRIRLRKRIITRLYKLLENDGRLPDLTWAVFCRTFGKIAYSLLCDFGVNYVISEYESRLLVSSQNFAEKAHVAFFYKNAIFRTAPNFAFCEKLEKTYNSKFEFLPQSVSLSVNKKTHDNFTFLSIGALTVDKGMDVVIRAFAKINRVYPSTRLCILGNGDEKNALLDQISRLKIENYVDFRTNYQSGFYDLIASSDCFVLASRKELFGTVFSAVMSIGVPIITTDCFSPKGLIPSFAGKIVPVDDVNALFLAMEEVILNENSYSAEKIANYAKSVFSMDACAKKIETLFERVAPPAHPQGFSY